MSRRGRLVKFILQAREEWIQVQQNDSLFAMYSSFDGMSQFGWMERDCGREDQTALMLCFGAHRHALALAKGCRHVRVFGVLRVLR